MCQSFEYIKSYLAKRLFGYEFSFRLGDKSRPSMSLDDFAKFITFPPFLSGFEHTALLKDQPLELRMVPADDFIRNILDETEIPILCEQDVLVPARLITLEENSVHINFDLLGTIFYILTRIEEIKSHVRDEHDRFPASASHALNHNYLHRPVVDEHIEILWRCIQHLWPGAERRQETFRTMVTHDVDAPFEYLFRPTWKMLRSFGSDILRRRNLRRAFSRAAGWFDVKYMGNWQKDPFYTFETIMDISESYGLKSAFYFLTEKYDLTHPRVRALINRIHERGHEIGYHGSYSTYLDSGRMEQEVRFFLKTVGRLQDDWGGRQHFLRWRAPVTWRNYTEAGLSYDTTLSYADCAGFRCGTCHPFKPFDIERGETLDLIEYPLTVMECSVLDEQYMNLPLGEAMEHMLKLKDACRKFNGIFVILWHNSSFFDPMEVEMFKQVLEG